MRLRGMGTCTTALVVLAMVAAVAAPGALAPTGAAGADPPVFEGPVPRADCGPGSDPEPPGALQGEVTQRDRDSGRSTRPYTCNLELVGNDANSPGAEWQDSWYGSCAYYDTKLQSGAGTQVVDAADPTKPVRTTALTSPAMLDPWESLSVNQKRGLLAGVYTNALFGPLYFDVYDVSKDCAHPALKASLPINTVGHEGEWAPDGLTYYGAGAVITAIDVSDPASPRPVGHIDTATTHGLSISDDGNRAYLAGQPIGSGNATNGLTIVDTSQIQARDPAPHTPVVGSITWDDGAIAQSAIPITIQGHPYVISFDEGPLSMGNGQGATRIIDVADEAHPRIVSKLKLEIQMPANGSRAAETGTSGFGYNTHYCGVPQRTDPGIVACSNFESGMRVFDIRDPYHPREIAYFNPGGTGKASPSGSQDGQNPVTSGYTSARVRLIPDRGEAWFTDQNKGLFITRFTNGVWPFRDSGASTPADLGLPSPAGPKTTATCVRKRSVSVRLRSPFRRSARRATVMVNGRAVKRVRGRALRRPIAVRLPSGHSVVRIVVQTRSGKRLVQTRGYTRCTGKRR